MYNINGANKEESEILVIFLSTELPQSESIATPDLVWRVLSVSAGAYGSHKLTGISRIVKTVITPLADFKVSVLVISTYQSDYVLVGFIEYKLHALA